VPADVSVTAGSPAGPLPALATSSYLRSAGQKVGSTFSITVGGFPLTVTVVREASAFPTISGPGGGLVIDQRSLQEALAAAGVQPPPVTEWWLRADSRPALARLPPGTVRTGRDAVAGSLLSDPLSAAPQQAMLVIAAAAVILAGGGFLVSAATASQRAADLAMLRAIGATRRQITRVVCLEQALLAIPGAAAGLALGGLLAWLVVPAVTLTSAGAHPVPPVAVQVPWAGPAVLAAVLAAVDVLIVGLAVGRRSALADRTEAEA
jgi:ABC-type antimicrobial peptide transport system permease subunit